MKKIKIKKTTLGCGFTAKPEYHTLEAVKFKNGKIVYLDTDESVRVLDCEADLKSYPNLEIVKGD